MNNLQPQSNQLLWTKENLNDPVFFIETFFNCKLWDKQKEIAYSVRDNRITAVRSCHSSGKSFDVARIGAWFLQTKKDSKVLTTAPSWTQVKEILWREIHSAINSLNEVDPSFKFAGKLLETKWDIAPDWFAIGLATKKEGEASEVAGRMLGFHSKTGEMLIIIDEGSGVLEPIWGAIETLMTSAGAKLLAIGNPYRITGGFARLFKQEGVNKIWIQDTDIPNIKENRIIFPGLMSPDYPIEMAKKYGVDSPIYQVKVKGNFPKSETDTLIPLDHIEDAFLRDVVVNEVEKRKLGVDVARYGHNFTVFVVRQGKKVLYKLKVSKEDTMQTAGRILVVMRDWQVKDIDVNIDDIGIGGGVVDRLQEKGLKVNGVNVGVSANNIEHFANLRAELYWIVREWIKDAGIIKDDDFYQLSNIKYKWRSEKAGQLIIEGKDEMKKRGLESPDVADALMLTFAGGGYQPFPEQQKINKEESRINDAPERIERKDTPFTGGLMDKEF